MGHLSWSRNILQVKYSGRLKVDDLGPSSVHFHSLQTIEKFWEQDASKTYEKKFQGTYSLGIDFEHDV